MRLQLVFQSEKLRLTELPLQLRRSEFPLAKLAVIERRMRNHNDRQVNRKDVLKLIAALKPRPPFLPILRMLNGVVEYDEVKGILVTENWQDRNRRDSNPRSSA